MANEFKMATVEDGWNRREWMKSREIGTLELRKRTICWGTELERWSEKERMRVRGIGTLELRKRAQAAKKTTSFCYTNIFFHSKVHDEDLIIRLLLQSHTTKVYLGLFNTIQLNSLVTLCLPCLPIELLILLQGFFKLFFIIMTGNSMILFEEFISSTFSTNGEAIVQGILSV